MNFADIISCRQLHLLQHNSFLHLCQEIVFSKFFSSSGISESSETLKRWQDQHSRSQLFLLFLSSFYLKIFFVFQVLTAILSLTVFGFNLHSAKSFTWCGQSSSITRISYYLLLRCLNIFGGMLSILFLLKSAKKLHDLQF